AAAQNFFANFLAQGGTVEQLIAIIAGGDEYFSTRGSGTNDGFLDALFHDALNRSVDSSGRAFYDGQLSANVSRSQVVTEVVSSDEYRRDLVQSFYLQFLDRSAERTGDLRLGLALHVQKG